MYVPIVNGIMFQLILIFLVKIIRYEVNNITFHFIIFQVRI